MRPVVVRRWHRALAFVAVTVSFVVAVSALEVSVRRTDRDARAADRLARQAHALAQRVDRQFVTIQQLRSAQFRQIHAADVRTCSARHRLVGVLRGILGRSVRQARALRLPGLTAAARRAAIANLLDGERDLSRADCSGVPPIPGST